MNEELSRLEKGVAGEELNTRMNEMLKKYLVEIIDLDPHFKFILTKLKTSYDQLCEKASTADKLQSTIAALTATITKLNEEAQSLYTKQSALEKLNEQLELHSAQLKKELEAAQGKLAQAKSKFTQIMELGMSDKIVEEFEDLFNETQRLRQSLAVVKIGLKKSQARERFLLKILKENKLFDKEIERGLEEVEVNIIEVGKSKVKIPLLNLSALEGSESDESESSGVNYSVKSDCGKYKKKLFKSEDNA
eukprot:TRINITY_DN17894_c0_g1_i2.p1 TRINITY_DN17894_c0_g1~~TRINITY_DN17894_c0_g1_i2.p1  ORF type:complete len:249 (-),score=84.91 TRINITY_DN17894_c0_g1_i2:147-893(-)